MPPRSSIGKRIVRRPASYEEEPDTDDGENLARVIVRTFALLSKKESVAIEYKAIIPLRTFLFGGAPRAMKIFCWLCVVAALSLSRFLIIASILNRPTTRGGRG